MFQHANPVDVPYKAESRMLGVDVSVLRSLGTKGEIASRETTFNSKPLAAASQ